MLKEDPSRSSVFVGLLHHSMRNKSGELVTTAVTNLDVHDIARASRTFGAAGYYLIQPLEEQKQVVNRIIAHWMGSGGRDYNPDRSDAFELTKVVDWLQDAIADITRRTGEKPFVVMTSARRVDGVERFTCRALREKFGESSRPVFLVFGTGWGIDESVLKTADAVLEPIEPERDSGYNHLSVRSAVAIYLDRLLGNGRG